MLVPWAIYKPSVMLTVEITSVLLIEIMNECASVVDRRDYVALLDVESPYTD